MTALWLARLPLREWPHYATAEAAGATSRGCDRSDVALWARAGDYADGVHRPRGARARGI